MKNTERGDGANKVRRCEGRVRLTAKGYSIQIALPSERLTERVRRKWIAEIWRAREKLKWSCERQLGTQAHRTRPFPSPGRPPLSPRCRAKVGHNFQSLATDADEADNLLELCKDATYEALLSGGISRQLDILHR